MLKEFFLKGINLIIIIFTYLLSYIIPKKDNLYIFGSADGKSYDGNSKEVFNFYKNKKECFYISHNKNLKNTIKNNFLYAKSIKSYWVLLRAKYIFLDSSIKHISFLYAIIGNFSIILLWHGDGFKKIEFENPHFSRVQSKLGIYILKKQYKNIKLGITGNFFNQNTFNKSFLINNFKVTGLPRNNILLENNKVKDKNIIKIKKQDFSKIILYVPTWRDSKIESYLEPFSMSFISKFDKYLSSNNYLFIYKPHPLSKVKYKNTKNIKIIQCPINTQELLKISDILITDYSSIYIDFLLTDKPILFYTYDYKEYIKNDKDLYFQYDDILINEGSFNQENKLVNYIENIENISSLKIYKQKYQKLKFFFHQYKNKNILENLDNEIKKLK